MNNTMKSFKLTAMLLLLGVLLVSCGKQEVEWSQYKGYTNADIIGSYTNSNITEAFEGLTESAFCHVCYDAQVTIANVGGKVQFDLKSPNIGFTVSLQGSPMVDDQGFLMQMTTMPFELTASVYTNKANEVRLHGFVRKKSGMDYINYYFDVVKN